MLGKELLDLVAYQLLGDLDGKNARNQYDVMTLGDLMNDSDLQPSEWQSILQSVFPILLRVGVQHYIIHLIKNTERANKMVKVYYVYFICLSCSSNEQHSR